MMALIDTIPLKAGMEQRPKHHRSLRIPGYDYSTPGAYFVTICTHQRELRLGEIDNNVVRLNSTGHLVLEVWQSLSSRYPDTDFDPFIVMPNHLHAIIGIKTSADIGSRPTTTRQDLTSIIRTFKSLSTVLVNKTLGTPGWPLWQRGYYEHVIRNEDEFTAIGQYIIHNAAKWDTDQENPNQKPNNAVSAPPRG
jgi:REP element-mobilizing transposase RayT